MSGEAAAPTAAQLRRAFDASFAKAASGDQETREDLLVIRAGERRLALRTAEIAAIVRGPPLTELPSDNPALCGLAAIRSTLLCVYSVASLLGDPRRPVARGWLVVCAADASAALLFDELLGHGRVRSADIHRAEAPRGGRLAHEVVRIGGAQHTVLSVPDLLAKISGGAARTGSEGS